MTEQEREPVRWKFYGERPIYTDPWVNLWLVDVEQPDGRRWEHHVVKMRHLAVAVVVDDHQRVLMLRRHRFITDAAVQRAVANQGT